MTLSNEASFSVLGHGGPASLEVGRSAGATGLLAVPSGAQLLVEGESGGSRRLTNGRRGSRDGPLAVNGRGSVGSDHGTDNGTPVGNRRTGTRSEERRAGAQ